jgi:hypothetical protein
MDFYSPFTLFCRCPITVCPTRSARVFYFPNGSNHFTLFSLRIFFGPEPSNTASNHLAMLIPPREKIKSFSTSAREDKFVPCHFPSSNLSALPHPLPSLPSPFTKLFPFSPLPISVSFPFDAFYLSFLGVAVVLHSSP